MSAAKIRAIKLQKLRASHADDAPTKPAWQALQQVESITADIDARRAELEQSARFTPHGIFEELKPLREKHAKALRAAQTALKSSAETLLAKGNTEIYARRRTANLDVVAVATLAERNAALVRAMNGRDAELRAVLAHPSSERYHALTESSLALLRAKFVDADAHADNVPRLAAHAIANDLITETLATLEQ